MGARKSSTPSRPSRAWVGMRFRLQSQPQPSNLRWTFFLQARRQGAHKRANFLQLPPSLPQLLRWAFNPKPSRRSQLGTFLEIMLILLVESQWLHRLRSLTTHLTWVRLQPPLPRPNPTILSTRRRKASQLHFSPLRCPCQARHSQCSQTTHSAARKIMVGLARLHQTTHSTPSGNVSFVQLLLSRAGSTCCCVTPAVHFCASQFVGALSFELALEDLLCE
jgi:hypothetical protein